MEGLLLDLRYGLRVFLKSPSFTALGVIALALGIGANTAIFSIINTALLRPLPYRDPGRLIWVWDVQPQLAQAPASFPEFVDWQNQNQVFEQMAGLLNANFNMTDAGEPERIRGAYTTANFFSLLGVNPIIGRSFLPEEGQPGGARVVIIGNGLWQRRFGADPKLVGKTLTLSGNTYTVIGILAPDHGIITADLMVPLALDVNKTSRGSHFLSVLARLKPGVSAGQAQADMDTVAARLRQEHSTTHGIRLTTLQDHVAGSSRYQLFILMGAVGFVLLIACANVANLLLARAAARQREIAVRTALGATRWRVIRQLLTESVLLSLTGGILGILLAYLGIRLLVSLDPVNIPHVKDIAIDGRVLAFTVALSCLTGLLFGLVPAFQSSAPNLNESLKEGGRGSGSGFGTLSFRSALVVSEIGLALLLLIGAGLLIKSFFRLLNVNPGFSSKNVLVMQTNLPQSKYGEDARIVDFYQQVIQRVASLPGVQSAGITDTLPVDGGGSNGNFTIEGITFQPNETPLSDWLVVSPDYFRVMSIPLLQGRLFTERDSVTAPNVVIVNEAFAKRFWPNESPLGKRILSGYAKSENGWQEVVGVVGNVKYDALDAPLAIAVYHPYKQVAGSYMNVVVRTNGDPLALVSAVRSQIWAVDKDQPVYNIKSMEELLSSSVGQQRLRVVLLGLFAALALVLSTIGIYGVMAHSVSQRTREIGIRMALGAQRADVLKLVVGQGLLLGGIGVFLGLVASVALTRALTSFLFGVSPTDASTFGLIAFILLAVAVVASYLPARRASRVDPLVALRYE